MKETPGRHATASMGFFLAAFVYLVLFGGTGLGELHPVLRIVNAAIGAAVIGFFLLGAQWSTDWVDRAVIGAVLLFSGAALLSAFPRQSFDAVLSALAYAAAFFVARRLLSDAWTRRWFVRTAAGLSLVLTIVFAAAWLPAFVELWRLSGVTPSLDIAWSAGPWGHRYDAVLLLALLYPAWWIASPSPIRRAIGVIAGGLGVALLVIAGSRTVWAAVVAATVVVVVPVVFRALRDRTSRRVMAAALGAAAVAGVGLVSITPLADRLLNFTSAGWRLAMWGPLVDIWLERPLAGAGPGSFPWLLQLTPYFDTNAHAPRHPDSVLFQVLPEAGLLGLGAVVLVLAAVGAAVVSRRSLAGLWVLALVVVASVGNNPTDFAFLVVPALAWSAYAVPQPSIAVPRTAEWRSRVYVVAASAASAAIVLAYAATLAAGVVYEQARTASARGSEASALGQMQLAASFDPGMGLFARQHGALALVRGQHELATSELERAADLNRSDDVAWRALSLSHEAMGAENAAREAVARAVEVQRSDPLNLLLSAHHAARAGRGAEAVEALAEVVQAWPAIVASPGWTEQLPEGTSTADVIDAAASRWLAGAQMPQLPADHGLWLAVMSGEAEVMRTAVEGSPFSERETIGLLALLGCEVDASPLLEAPTAIERRGFVYWTLRVIEGRSRGVEDSIAGRVLHLMSGGVSGEPQDSLVNPLNEGPGWSADRWGYRRYPTVIRSGNVRLPSVTAGPGIWIADPMQTAARLGIDDRLRSCSLRAGPR